VQRVKCRKSWGVRGRGWVQNIKVGIRKYLGLLSRRSLQILEGGRPIPLREEGKVAEVGWICQPSCFALQASFRPATCVGEGWLSVPLQPLISNKSVRSVCTTLALYHVDL
jgi:hypothetical protein